MTEDFWFIINKKIIDAEEWAAERERNEFETVIFTNGCFDILHHGHIRYLAQARSQGDCLVVGLNSDESVRRLKGPDRPINAENDRALQLASLCFVSYVILFEEDTPEELIHIVKPDILVKGGDYELDEIAGADFVLKRGGLVETIPFVDGYSTSNMIEKIGRDFHQSH